MTIIKVNKARKKPVEVEFIHFKNQETGQKILEWIGNDSLMTEGTNGKAFICISTLEGTMRASINDYIVKGVNGEFYAVKPDVFKKTYDILPYTIQECRTDRSETQ